MPAGRKVFHVPVAIEEAWAFLSSMERVGRCVPGCEDVCAIDDRRSSWTVRADMGPFSRRLQMEAMTIEFDPPRHGAFRATGKGLETVGSIDLRAISAKETEVAYAITASARGFGATLIDNAIALVIQNQAEQFAANVKANLKEAAAT